MRARPRNAPGASPVAVLANRAAVRTKPVADRTKPVVVPLITPVTTDRKRTLATGFAVRVGRLDFPAHGRMLRDVKGARTVVITIAVVLALAVSGVLAIAYAGAVNVAASDSDTAIVRWFLRTARDHSIAKRAAGLEIPALDDPAKLRVGEDHYHAMCVGCHGGPGTEPSEAGLGLNPTPPKLHELGTFDDTRLRRSFWIIKHGIGMTGMPSFGKTHSDEEIWAITAYVRKLGSTSAEEFRAHAPEAVPAHRHGPEPHEQPASSAAPPPSAQPAASAPPEPGHEHHGHEHKH